MTPTGTRAARFGPVTLPGTAIAVKDPASVLVIGVWLAVTVSQVARSLGQRKVYRPITEGLPSIPVWVDRVETVCDALVLLGCIAVIIVGWRRGARPRQVWLVALLLAPWVALVARQVASGGSVGAGILPYLALVGALWLVRPRFGVIQTLGYLTAAGAVLAIVLALVAPSAGLYTGGVGYLAEKPIGPWGILAGFLPTGNNMGRFLVIGLPSVLTIRNARHRWAAAALTVLAVLWTASRTSTAGVVVVLGVLVVLRLLAGHRDVRARLSAAGLAGLGLLVVVLPFVVTSPEQFNHRAKFWMFLLDRWRESPWLGQGLDYFERLANEAVNLGGYAYHGHNLAVQTLITGGLVAAIPVLALLVVAGARAVRLTRSGVEWGVPFVAVVLTVSVLEVPVSFADDVKANLPALLPLFILLLAGTRTGEEDAPTALAEGVVEQ